MFESGSYFDVYENEIRKIYAWYCILFHLNSEISFSVDFLSSCVSSLFTYIRKNKSRLSNITALFSSFHDSYVLKQTIPMQSSQKPNFKIQIENIYIFFEVDTLSI